MIDRTPEALRALLAGAEWQLLFAEVAALSPPVGVPNDVVAAFLRHHGHPVLDLGGMTLVDRVLAERYLAFLVEFELAYGSRRLARVDAVAAAAAFMHPFGSDAVFYTTISLTPAVLAAKETNAPRAYSVFSGVFGSTLEEGLVAFDPAGMVGAVFVGDED